MLFFKWFKNKDKEKINKQELELSIKKKKFIQAIHQFNIIKNVEYKTLLGALLYKEYQSMDLELQNEIQLEKGEAFINLIKNMQSQFLTNAEMDKLKNNLKPKPPKKFELLERPSGYDLLFIDEIKNVYAIDVGVRTIQITQCKLDNIQQDIQELTLSTDYGFEYETKVVRYYRQLDCIVVFIESHNKIDEDMRYGIDGSDLYGTDFITNKSYYITYNVSKKLQPYNTKYREDVIKLEIKSLDVLINKYHYKIEISEEEKKALEKLNYEREQKRQREIEEEKQRIEEAKNCKKYKLCVLKKINRIKDINDDNWVCCLGKEDVKEGDIVTDSEGDIGKIVKIGESVFDVYQYVSTDAKIERFVE